MAVPETAMYKNHCLIFRKYHIGFTRIAFVIFSIAQAAREQIFPNQLLRLGILAPNT